MYWFNHLEIIYLNFIIHLLADDIQKLGEDLLEKNK